MAALAFIRAMGRDRAFAPTEIDFIQMLAVRDSVVDDDEREVVSRIFRRISRKTVSPEIWDEIERFKYRIGV